MSSEQARAFIHEAIRERYLLYEPVIPGDSSFRCRPEGCRSLCCRSLTVVADDADAGRLRAGTGRPLGSFLECEAGEPIRLPLAQPYVLARRGDGCAFLDRGGSCEAYPWRPNACRSYPFEVRLIRKADLGEQMASEAAIRAALDAEADGRDVDLCVLLRHRDCPGFTGPPLSVEQWRQLAVEIAGFRTPAPDASATQPAPDPAP